MWGAQVSHGPVVVNDKDKTAGNTIADSSSASGLRFEKNVNVFDCKMSSVNQIQCKKFKSI